MSSTPNQQNDPVTTTPAAVNCLVDDAEACRLVEHYLSKESLPSQPYLISRMSTDMWISLEVLAEFKPLKDLKIGVSTIQRAVQASELVALSEDKASLRPKIKLERKTLILRDISSSDVKEVEKIFEFLPEQDRPVELRNEVGNNWYATFASEEKCLQAHLSLGDKKFGDQPIRSRVKPETLLKTLYQHMNYQTPRFLQQQVFVPAYGGPDKVVPAGPVPFVQYRPYGIPPVDQHMLTSPSTHPYPFPGDRSRNSPGRGRGSRQNTRKTGMRRVGKGDEPLSPSTSATPAPQSSSSSSNSAPANTSNASATPASATPSASSNPSASSSSGSRPPRKTENNNTSSASSAGGKGKGASAAPVDPTRLSSNMFPPLPGGDPKQGDASASNESSGAAQSESPKGESEKPQTAAPTSSAPRHQPKNEKVQEETSSQQRTQKTEEAASESSSKSGSQRSAGAAAYAHVVKQTPAQQRPQQPQQQQQQQQPQQSQQPAQQTPQEKKPEATSKASGDATSNSAAKSQKHSSPRRGRGNSNANAPAANNSAAASGAPKPKGKGREGREGKPEGKPAQSGENKPAGNNPGNKSASANKGKGRGESNAKPKQQTPSSQEHVEQSGNQPAAKPEPTSERPSKPKQPKQQSQPQTQSGENVSPSGSSFRDALLRTKAPSPAEAAAPTAAQAAPAQATASS